MKRLINILVLVYLFGSNHVLLAQVLRHDAPQTNTLSYGELFRRDIQVFLVNSENLFRKGQQIAALQELDFAVEIAPQNPEVYLHRAMLKLRIGMTTEAQKDIATAKRLNPISPALFGIEGPNAQLDLLAFYPEQLYQELSWLAAYSLNMCSRSLASTSDS